MRLDPHHRSDRPLEKIGHAAHEGRYVDRLRVEVLPARKSEHALGQGGAAFGTLDGVLEERLRSVVVPQAFAQ